MTTPKLTSGCVSGASVCQIELPKEGKYILELNGISCEAGVNGYHCGEEILPFVAADLIKYEPGQRQARLTLHAPDQPDEILPLYLPRNQFEATCQNKLKSALWPMAQGLVESEKDEGNRAYLLGEVWELSPKDRASIQWMEGVAFDLKHSQGSSFADLAVSRAYLESGDDSNANRMIGNASGEKYRVEGLIEIATKTKSLDRFQAIEQSHLVHVKKTVEVAALRRKMVQGMLESGLVKEAKRFIDRFGSLEDRVGCLILVTLHQKDRAVFNEVLGLIKSLEHEPKVKESALDFAINLCLVSPEPEWALELPASESQKEEIRLQVAEKKKDLKLYWELLAPGKDEYFASRVFKSMLAAGFNKEVHAAVLERGMTQVSLEVLRAVAADLKDLDFCRELLEQARFNDKERVVSDDFGPREDDTRQALLAMFEAGFENEALKESERFANPVNGALALLEIAQIKKDMKLFLMAHGMIQKGKKYAREGLQGYLDRAIARAGLVSEALKNNFYNRQTLPILVEKLIEARKFKEALKLMGKIEGDQWQKLQFLKQMYPMMDCEVQN